MVKLSVLAATAAVGFALAQAPAAPGPPPADAVKSYLGLTDAQIQSLLQIQQQERSAQQSTMAQLQQLHQSLQALVSAGGADPAAVGKIVLQAAALHQQMKQTASGFVTRAAGVLTADQQTRLAALQSAAKLQPAIHQAMELSLITPPDGGPGGGGNHMMPGPGMGPHAFHMLPSGSR